MFAEPVLFSFRLLTHFPGTSVAVTYDKALSPSLRPPASIFLECRPAWTNSRRSTRQARQTSRTAPATGSPTLVSNRTQYRYTWCVLQPSVWTGAGSVRWGSSSVSTCREQDCLAMRDRYLIVAEAWQDWVCAIRCYQSPFVCNQADSARKQSVDGVALSQVLTSSPATLYKCQCFSLSEA